MEDSFLPVELVSNSNALIESVHKSHGCHENLPKALIEKEYLTPLLCLPEGRIFMQHASFTFKLRMFCWIIGLIIIGLSIFISKWLLTGLLIMAVVERFLAGRERRFYILSAATLLSLDILVSDFAGWGTAYPDERERALKILSDEEANFQTS